jgi:hypothetical protein
MLGMALRSKILFSIPFLDFKYTLHAHSHFAFGGWVSLAIMALMVYDILPERFSKKPVYKWLLAAILLNAIGMLISFLLEGYAFFSIFFSTVFIFVSYVFAAVFTRDIYRSKVDKSIRLLCLGALAYMVLSSAGPFTLAYLMASKSANAVLYKDAIYTYLHLQYNGFFTLAVFALFFNTTNRQSAGNVNKLQSRFAYVLVFSVIPSMFLCYLWHYPNQFFYIIAIMGSISMLLALFYFSRTFSSAINTYRQMELFPKTMISLSFIAFTLKMIFQSLTIFKAVGDLVFSNRPIIIGFLHLVLLGFISLFLLARLHQSSVFRHYRLAIVAGYSFATSVILNELVLMGQGLGIMLQVSSSIYPVLLWLISILLFSSAGLLVLARFLPANVLAIRPASNTVKFIKISNSK